MRVDHDRVGAVTVVEHPPHLRHHRRGSTVGRVHVQPQTEPGADVGNLTDRVDAGRRGRPDGRHDRDRAPPGGDISLDRSRQLVDLHAVLIVNADRPRSRRAPAPVRCTPSRPTSGPRGTRTRAAAGDRYARPSPGRARPDPAASRAPASAVKVEVDAESVIWPNSPAGNPTSSAPIPARPARAPWPPARFAIASRSRSASPPSSRRGSRGRAGVGEVREKAGMVPVRQPRHDHPVDVVDHGLQGLAGGRRVLRQRGPDLPGTNPRCHWNSSTCSTKSAAQSAARCSAARNSSLDGPLLTTCARPPPARRRAW